MLTVFPKFGVWRANSRDGHHVLRQKPEKPAYFPVEPGNIGDFQPEPDFPVQPHPGLILNMVKYQ